MLTAKEARELTEKAGKVLTMDEVMQCIQSSIERGVSEYYFTPPKRLSAETREALYAAGYNWAAYDGGNSIKVTW